MMSFENVKLDLFFVIVVFAVYFPSLDGDFVFDDSEAIVKNPDILSTSSFVALFGHDFWGNNISRESSHKSYRPLSIAVYRLLHGIQPYQVWIYHLANLLLYSTLACQLFRALSSLFQSRDIFAYSRDKSKELAWLATTLFIVHPVHAESVCACVGLADILCGLCCVLALRVHLTHTYHCFETIGKIFLVCTATLFKEQGVTFLGVFIFLNVCSLVRRPQNAKNRIQDVVFCVISTVLLVTFRLWVMNFQSPKFADLDNPFAVIPDSTFRYLNLFYIYLLNIFIVLCPIWLCFDWSMGCIAPIESFSDPRLFLVIVCLFLSILLVVSLRKRLDLVIFIGAFSALPFLPSSNLFFRVGFVIAERNLFLPLIGYCLLFSTGYNRIHHQLRTNWRIFFRVILVLFLFTLALRSNLRSYHWRNEWALFTNDLSVCPNNAKIHYNIAKLASDGGRTGEASRSYRRALELHPNYTSALNNYANILRSERRLGEARQLFRRSLDIDPDYGPALMNFAILEKDLKNYEHSLELFKRALKVRPRHAETHYNLANLHLETKDLLAAEESFSNALSFNPRLVQAWNNLILLNQNNGLLEIALRHANEAIRINPAQHLLHFNAGTLYGQLKKFEEAESHLQEAIRLAPNNPSYLYNLAVLYHQNGHVTKAKGFYEQTLVIKPDHVNAQRQLRRL